MPERRRVIVDKWKNIDHRQYLCTASLCLIYTNYEVQPIFPWSKFPLFPFCRHCTYAFRIMPTRYCQQTDASYLTRIRLAGCSLTVSKLTREAGLLWRAVKSAEHESGLRLVVVEAL